MHFIFVYIDWWSESKLAQSGEKVEGGIKEEQGQNLS